MENVYQAPRREGLVKFIDYDDLAMQAQKVLSPGAWGYLAGGAGDELTMKANTRFFDRYQIYPRVMTGVEKPVLKTTILGTEISSPIIMAPAAAHGLEHISAERGTAKGAAAAGTIMCVSTYSNDTMEDIAAAGGGAPQWYQLYFSKDSFFNRDLIKRAAAAGAKALILTVDATVGGNREADVRNNFSMPLAMANLEKAGQSQGLTIKQIFANALQRICADDIGRIAEEAHLPVVVKGIQHPDDAKIAIDAGAAAIWVSNHGGRQLDGGPASLAVLPVIVETVKGAVPIIFDSGIRRGRHVFEALACGADITAIGRPALMGLALGGWQGVSDVFEFFNRELAMVMQLAGTADIAGVRRSKLGNF